MQQPFAKRPPHIPSAMNDIKHPDGGKRRRALITGLSGFTGRHMAARLLDEGYDVWGTTSPASEPDVPGTTGVPVDLLDLDAVRACVSDAQPEVVVHLAGLAHVTGNSPTQSYLVNIMGSRNLLDALSQLDKKPRAVLMASTSNVYGNVNVEVIDENVPLNPGNDYAVSKLAMEHVTLVAGPLAHLLHAAVQLHRRWPGRRLPVAEDRQSSRAS